MLREGYEKASVSKKVPIPDRDTSEAVVADLLKFGFILKGEKDQSFPNKFTIAKSQTFTNDNYYFWVYQGSQWRGIALGFGVIFIILAGVMFPLWPALPRQGVYYLSLLLIGFIGFIMGLGVIRAILWMLLKILLGKGGWLFPNLFADVGFIESFKPFWA